MMCYILLHVPLSIKEWYSLRSDKIILRSQVVSKYDATHCVNLFYFIPLLSVIKTQRFGSSFYFRLQVEG